MVINRFFRSASLSQALNEKSITSVLGLGLVSVGNEMLGACGSHEVVEALSVPVSVGSS